MKAAFHTLGCKVNQYETEAMAEQFRKAGYEIAGERDAADVYVINTCTVTGLADRKSRQFMRRAKKINPDAVVAVTGCYAQISPEDIAQIPEVDIIAGTNEKHMLLAYVSDLMEERERKDIIPPHESVHVRSRSQMKDYEEMPLSRGLGSRTRAYIKIEEGCDRFCSYCVIPYARGPVRSRKMDDILSEAESLTKAGYRELILTGINTALYEDLPGLLSRLDEMEGDFRIRLSSLEPTVVDREFVRTLFPSKRLCHHLHLSMQSGSNRVLAAMNRHYSREEYFAIVDELREFDPLYGITTDIITGFPGETEEDFLDSIDAVQRCGFAKVHAFRYSERPGTKAAAMAEKVDPSVRKERAERLSKAGMKAAQDFFERNVGTVQTVLFETGGVEENGADSGEMTGYTDNYIKVYHKRDDNLTNKFSRVRITGLCRDGVRGEIL